MQKAADLNNAAAVLGWDQEVYMPPKGAALRGRQLATLAAAAHELLTSEGFGKLLNELSETDGLSDLETANVRLSLEDYKRNKKLPADFIEEMSLLTSESFNAWVDARRKNDYRLFAPCLGKMVTLKRKQASLIGYEHHPYDALLDEYEKGANVAMLDRIFDGIRRDLSPLLAAIKSRPQVSNDCFHQHFPGQQQWDFGISVLKQMGFDFEAGRQDYSAHPFTTSFGPSDVRITTRADEDNFASMLWSCIHEGGHGLYEQGLPESQYGLPLGAPVSLGIHESQSRFWENCIGRSKDFWLYFYPALSLAFPQQLGHVDIDTFYNAANRVAPSLIRTEADEVTYHFHILIRYEIEKELIEGKLDTMAIPARWNELYEHYLGIRPPDDASGVLQDVHWSHGSFGYFPTYTLGSFYAAQLYKTAQSDIAQLAEHIRNGALNPLLLWLRSKVHVHGRRFTSEELCRQITGRDLDPAVFIAYAREKYSAIYGFQ